jgi:hypothetical protein
VRAASVFLPLALLVPGPLAAAEVINVPSFRAVELRGGGSVIVKPGPVRVSLIEGSSRVSSLRVDREGKLVISACTGQCPRNYRLRVEISYPRVPPMAVNGGGSIVASPGFAMQDKVAAGVSGGGSIDLRSVSANSTAAGINGGGRILAGRSRTLAAAVNGGGEVRYLGNPQVTTAINGGGIVRQGS